MTIQAGPGGIGAARPGDRPGTAMVSGAGRGIGLSICRRLCEAGFHVVGMDVDENALKNAFSELREAGFKATDLCVDVAREQDVLSIPDRISDRLGDITCLVNNAAWSPRDERGRKIPVLELALETWERAMRINLTAAFLMCRTIAPFMVANGFGRIVNISSLGGRTSISDLTTSAYGVSKAGLIGFTRILARELAGHGITVNAVCPGRIETSMATAANPSLNADYLKKTPVGRFGTPEEVAEMVRYLAGPDAGFVTGASFDINGGAWMG